MEIDSNEIKIVVLAAGKGKRMQSDLPKVLSPLGGKHMIKHLIQSVQEVYEGRPIVVVGHQSELVESELGPTCKYVIQKDQLGTGHAVASTKEACNDAEHVVILSGDQPFISGETIKNLVEKNSTSKAKITFTTTEVENFEDWRVAFISFGRIIRKNNEVVGIREYRDATLEEKQIREVNAGSYVFDANWLWENIEKIKNNNTQGEFYLTDLIQIAKDEGAKIETIKIDPREALGANTKAELEILEKFAIAEIMN